MQFTRFDGDLSTHAEDMPDLTDGRGEHSPTSLEQWAECPHAWFVRRVLGVRAVEEPGEQLRISPLDRGLVMHGALEDFVTEMLATGTMPGGAQPWTPHQRERLAELGATRADAAEAQGLTGHPALWEIDRAEILRGLDLFLDDDEGVRASSGRRQVQAELGFGRGAPPVVVTLPDGRPLPMTGSVDRVDVTDEGGVVVVDYKTGSTRRYEGISQSEPDKHGTALQLPVYAEAARASVGAGPDAPVRAEYWFIGPRDRGTRIGLTITPEVLERFGQVLTTVVDGIGSGVFPQHPPERSTFTATWVECPYCDADGLGTSDSRARWERKRHAAELAAYRELAEGPLPPGPSTTGGAA